MFSNVTDPRTQFFGLSVNEGMKITKIISFRLISRMVGIVSTKEQEYSRASAWGWEVAGSPKIGQLISLSISSALMVSSWIGEVVPSISLTLNL